MEEKDFIKDLFQEKLSGLETPVRPELWSAVSSSIGASTVSTGLSLITKLIIGTSLTVAVSVGIWVAVSDSKESNNSDKNSTEQIQESTKINKNEQNIDPKPEQKEQKASNIIKPNIEEEKVLTLEFEMPVASNATQKQEVEAFKDVSNFNNSTVKQTEKQPSKSNIDGKTANQTKEEIISNTSIPEVSQVNINLPNVFTPNGDGSNDYLSIPDLNVNDFSLVVLDESGKTVYTSTDLDFRWDGRLPSGEIAPTGNYVYFITAKDAQGKSVTKYSPLNIRY